MDRYTKYKVIINGNKEDYQLDERFKSISPFLEECIWIDEIKTFQFTIHQKPTFELIRNQFSFENKRDMTGQNKLSYEKHLSSEKIESLSFWEYENEKIFGLMIYGRWNDMWESAKSKDLLVVTQGLLKYFGENQLTEYHEETIEELKRLNHVAEFCFNYDYEIHFFDPDI